MIQTLDVQIKQLEYMKKYPDNIYYIGNIDLLKNKMVSIVGTRKPTPYTKQFTYNISKALSQNNITIVSGAAMGVDAIAHSAAGTNNTIAVAGTGLDIRYPATNKKLIQDIEQNGLMLSMFKANTQSMPYNFPLRNEIVVALGDILIVTQSDEKSGTMRSVEFALKMGKKIYVLPHRLEESKGTQKLLEQNLATPIYNIDNFVSEIVGNDIKKDNLVDPIFEYLNTNPTFDEATQKYPNELFEYELNGKIEVKNGRVIVI